MSRSLDGSWIEIMRVGSTKENGVWYERCLDELAEEFHKDAARLIPITIGDPKISGCVYADVSQLRRAGESLWAQLRNTHPTLIRLLHEGWFTTRTLYVFETMLEGEWYRHVHHVDFSRDSAAVALPDGHFITESDRPTDRVDLVTSQLIKYRVLRFSYQLSMGTDFRSRHAIDETAVLLRSDDEHVRRVATDVVKTVNKLLGEVKKGVDQDLLTERVANVLKNSKLRS